MVGKSIRYAFGRLANNRVRKTFTKEKKKEGIQMKYRKSFVTNSSSSSYIITIDNNIFDEETINKYPCLKSYQKILQIIVQGDSEHFTSRYSEETEPGFLIRNKRELYRYIETEAYNIKANELGEDYLARLNDDDWEKEHYLKILDLLEKGKIVVVRQISYHDSLNDLLESLEELGAITIVNKDD